MAQDKKPANLRANAMPTDGYVLAVDGKLKMRYETAKEATEAAAKLKQSFPVIQVAVYDAVKQTYAPVEPVEPVETKHASSLPAPSLRPGSTSPPFHRAWVCTCPLAGTKGRGEG